MKLFLPPDCPTSLQYYEQYGYPQAVPFSYWDLAAKRIEQTYDSSKADIIYLGQYHDTLRHLLKRERFPWLSGAAEKCVLDLEGDWRDCEYPDWIGESGMNVIAVNALPKHRSWNLFVRPGCSRFLMDLVKREVEYTEPHKHGFYFRGQPDLIGVRQRVGEALKLADVDHEFTLNHEWRAVVSADDERVKEFEGGIRNWSFGLCPAGYGNFSVRFYEVCALGRVPVVISDNLWFGEEKDNHEFIIRIARDSTVEQIADVLADIQTWPLDAVTEMGRRAKEWFESTVKRYFFDPTQFYLRHLNLALEKGGIL